MENKIDEMLSTYGLNKESSILPMLENLTDDEIRACCWEVLRSYPDLKKEDWIIGLEGGDYIYSFAGNFVFITDDIWNFNLIAKPATLALLLDKIKQR